MLLGSSQPEAGDMRWDRQGSPRQKVAKNVAKTCSSVLWKAGLVNAERGDLAEEISKQSLEALVCGFSSLLMVTREGREVT